MTKPRTGTLTERTAGVWRLQTTSDPDAVTGETRRMSRAFRGTKSEATSALHRFVTECGAGLQAGSVVSVAVLLEQFMSTATLAPTTRQDWQSVVNRHLVPEVGHIALHRLTARDCDHLYRRMTLAGLGSSRVRNAHVILHRAVAQAVRWGWLVRNPMSDATRPEVPRVVVEPPEVDEVRRLLSLAGETDPELGCWLDVAAATGARRGEICALRWSDIDLERRTVRIERSVSATKEHGVFIKTTKTDRFRLVSLTAQATRSLTAQRQRIEQEQPNTFGAIRRTDLVFPNSSDTTLPWRPELVTRRWERLRTRAGLPHAKLHGLRRFVATELLTAGIDVRTVANRLGHARTSTTLDIYWAWVPARDRQAADPSNTSSKHQTRSRTSHCVCFV